MCAAPTAGGAVNLSWTSAWRSYWGSYGPSTILSIRLTSKVIHCNLYFHPFYIKTTLSSFQLNIPLEKDWQNSYLYNLLLPVVTKTTEPFIYLCYQTGLPEVLHPLGSLVCQESFSVLTENKSQSQILFRWAKSGKCSSGELDPLESSHVDKTDPVQTVSVHVGQIFFPATGTVQICHIKFVCSVQLSQSCSVSQIVFILGRLYWSRKQILLSGNWVHFISARSLSFFLCQIENSNEGHIASFGNLLEVF